MVIVLRAGGLSVDRISVVTSTIGVFMETLLMMAVGAAVAGIVICWLPVPIWMIAGAALVAVAASVPTLPPILKRVALKVSHRRPAADRKTPDISSTQFFLVGWIWSLLSWVLIGISFTLLTQAIPDPSPAPATSFEFAVCTAAIALAMVVGFASLLPGGAGVRELVLTTVLAQAVGPTTALLAAIAARLMFIAVEAICALCAWAWLRTQGEVETVAAELTPEATEDDQPALQPE